MKDRIYFIIGKLKVSYFILRIYFSQLKDYINLIKRFTKSFRKNTRKVTRFSYTDFVKIGYNCDGLGIDHNFINISNYDEDHASCAYGFANKSGMATCTYCDKEYNISSDYDICFNDMLPGVKNACCGHGIKKFYIEFENNIIIRGYITDIEKGS